MSDQLTIQNVVANNVNRLYPNKFSSKLALAEVSGCDEKTIRRLLKGEANITISTLERIAKALEVEPEVLLKK